MKLTVMNKDKATRIEEICTSYIKLKKIIDKDSKKLRFKINVLKKKLNDNEVELEDELILLCKNKNINIKAIKTILKSD